MTRRLKPQPPFHILTLHCLALKPVSQLPRSPKLHLPLRAATNDDDRLRAPVAQIRGSVPSKYKVIICPMGFLCPGLNVAEPVNEINIVIRENIPAAGWRDNYHLIVFFPCILTQWFRKIILNCDFYNYLF